MKLLTFLSLVLSLVALSAAQSTESSTKERNIAGFDPKVALSVIGIAAYGIVGAIHWTRALFLVHSSLVPRLMLLSSNRLLSQPEQQVHVDAQYRNDLHGHRIRPSNHLQQQRFQRDDLLYHDSLPPSLGISSSSLCSYQVIKLTTASR